MLPMVYAPGVITNKINASTQINHKVKRFSFLPFLPFYASTSAEISHHQFVIATTGAFTLTSVRVVSHRSCFFILLLEQTSNSAIIRLRDHSIFFSVLKMSQCMRFPTMWYVRPAKPQISLRIRAV